MRKLFLCQHIEYITLILCVIYCLFQQITTFFLIIFHTCIMTGHNVIIFQFTHPLKHLVKLQISITVNTGIWCGTMFIGIYKTIHNVFLKSLGKVEHIISDSHSVADVSGILHIVQGTAGFLPLNSYILIMKQFHGSTNTLITSFLCKQSSYRAVHSSAHCDNCFSHFFIPSCSASGCPEYYSSTFHCFRT